MVRLLGLPLSRFRNRSRGVGKLQPPCSTIFISLAFKKQKSSTTILITSAQDLLRPNHLQRSPNPSLLANPQRNPPRRDPQEARTQDPQRNQPPRLRSLRNRRPKQTPSPEDLLPTANKHAPNRAGRNLLHFMDKFRLGNPLPLLLQRRANLLNKLRLGHAINRPGPARHLGGRDYRDNDQPTARLVLSPLFGAQQRETR